ncbi:MAG TPA: DUF3455 domain-containing protein [Pyrinomonadaceae bacterium]|nr:DUF3455 domain-containing protein [Pyrinomonadaceae bacterium]HMP66128.1 DUF3455 domain-containing protein [Pyrinomonadaceae bacterium]
MYSIIKNKIVSGFLMVLGMAVLSGASYASVIKDDGLQAPSLPGECSGIQAPADTVPFFHTYAIGVQVYRWNGASWDFIAPIANLYASPLFRGKVGTHYAGPTWESNSGSKVVGRRLAGCTPDITAVPWLLLESDSVTGPGPFSKVSHIQRVNTSGGLAPTMPGTTVGEEKGVPYTTEYYFYRTAK